MAQFNADILLAVRGSEKAKREIEKLEASLDKLGRKASLDISGQIRLKGAQSLLKEEVKITAEYNKQLKVSQQIAREANQLARVRGNANQYGGPIGPGQASPSRLSSSLAQRRNERIQEQIKRSFTQYDGPIGPGQASPSRLSSSLAMRRNQVIQERSRGLNQFPLGVPAPAQDPVRDQQRRAKIIEKNIALRNRVKAIARATAKIEASRDARLKGQNSLTNGLLKLKQTELQVDKQLQKAALEKARDKAEELADQRLLNNELKKTQQYSKPIGPKEAPGAKGGARRGGGGAGGGLAAGIGFPLLFGSGPGSVIGGAIGSAGGFGTQILASAIGGIIDQAVASVAKLGQALNPITADIDAVVAAAGESSSAFGQLVKDLEKVAGKEAALAAATAQLVNVIGQDGVTALRQFGADATALGDATSVALTQTAAAVADLINVAGILKGLTAGIEKGNLLTAARESSDPEIKRLQEQLVGVSTGSSKEGTSGQRTAIEERIAARQLELQLIEERNIKEEAGVVAAEAKAAASNVEINSLKAQIALEESGLDLTTEAGVALAEKVIEQQTYVALQAAINSGLSTEAILLNETLQKLQLKARAVAEREAAQRKAEAAARKAASEQKRLAREAEQAAKQAAQLESSLNGERAKQLQLGNQSIALEFGEKIALQDKLFLNKEGLTLIAKIYNFKREQIKLTTEDTALEKEKLATLALQEKIETDQTKQKLQQLEIAERLAEIEGRQSIENTRAGLEQELGGLALGQTPELELANEQANRLTNTIKGLDDQLEKLKERRTGVFNQELETNIESVKGLKATYQELLPRIFAAEQAQLKFNQTFAAVSPLVNAGVNSLVSGLRDVVAGTKTAEEAFADFLNTITDQLIQTAATMIAQYIAIGLAKAFAGLGSNPSIPKGTLPGTNFFEARTPGLATGGTATGGQPYIVGEKGPELFIPGVTGTVTNNDQFEAARSAMGGGSGGSSDAFSENAESLAVANSYTRERVLERENSERSTSSGTMLIETQVINNVEYVSKEQLEVATAASAKQARAQVFSDMRNKPSTRRQLGLNS